MQVSLKVYKVASDEDVTSSIRISSLYSNKILHYLKSCFFTSLLSLKQYLLPSHLPHHCVCYWIPQKLKWAFFNYCTVKRPSIPDKKHLIMESASRKFIHFLVFTFKNSANLKDFIIVSYIFAQAHN